MGSEPARGSNLGRFDQIHHPTGIVAWCGAGKECSAEREIKREGSQHGSSIRSEEIDEWEARCDCNAACQGAARL